MRPSLASGALAFALTGSTARGCRTAVSDLDYHVVRRRPDVSDLPGEVDVFASSGGQLWTKLRDGDDFIHGRSACGCILFDAGIMRDALRCVVTEPLWPDAEKKIARLPEFVGLAERLIRIGDRDAAQDQVRATLTAAARGVLLRERVFPLSRKELPDQLRGIGMAEIGQALEETIYAAVPLEQLTNALTQVTRLVPDAVIATTRT